MSNIFRKKPEKQTEKPKVAVHQQDTSPTGMELMLLVIGGATLYGLTTITTVPMTAVGDMVSFGGPIPTEAAGVTTVNAAVVRDLWGNGGKSCILNLRAMVTADAMTEVDSVSPQLVVFHWLAPAKLPAIGCPGAPALLAVSAEDYQHMVTWRQTPRWRGLHR